MSCSNVGDPMGDAARKTLFISHSADMRELAMGISSALMESDSNSNLSVLTAAEALDGGNAGEAIRHVLGEADAVALIVTAETEPFAQYQWTEVLQSYWQDQSMRLLPVLVGDAEPPLFLQGLRSLAVEPDAEPAEPAEWIVSQLAGDAGEPDPAEAPEVELLQPWVPRLADKFDTRSRLLRRLDATIATLSEEQPDEEELREHREQLMDSCKERHDPKELALAYLNIGVIDLELRDHDAALEHLGRALKICEADPGGDGYPNRVSILIPLAATLAEMQQFAEALERLREAARIRAEADGSESRGVIAIKQELGAMLVRAREYEEAIDVLTHTLELNRRDLGRAHPRVEANELWLSLAQEKLDGGDSTTADRLLGIKPLTKVTSLLGIGYTMNQMDKLCEAQAALHRAVQLAEDPQIPAPIRASCHYYNGVALAKSRQWKDAVEELHKACAAHSREDIPKGWAASMFQLGNALRSAGQTDKAVDILEEVLDAAGEIYGPVSAEVAENHYNLGLALRDREDLDAARRHIEAAVKTISSLAGENDPRAVKYRRTLARLNRVTV